MSLLSDSEIRARLDRDIIIEPFQEEHLTAVGYDITVGDFVCVLDGPVYDCNDGKYEIPGRASALVWSREFVWVSKRIAGTVHSCVSLVSQGISHISTTLDPGWAGTFVIMITNNTEKPVTLEPGQLLATIVFHRLRRPATKPVKYAGGRPEVIVKQIEDRTAEAAKKLVSNYFRHTELNEKLAVRIRTVSRPFATRTANAIYYYGRHLWFRRAAVVLWTMAAGIMFLPALYWDLISAWLFNGVPYNLKAFTLCGAIATGLVTLGFAAWRRR